VLTGLAVLAVLAACLGRSVRADAPAAAAADEVPAVWTPKQLHFVYLGIGTKFSCDGLTDRLKEVLLQLGARHDLKVHPSGCWGPGGVPDAFPGASIEMHVLEPLSAASAGRQRSTGDKVGDTTAQTVRAHWQMVDVTGRQDVLRAAGECELIEQIKQSILPKFTTRKVEYSSTCIPFQPEPGGTRLRAEVLVTDQQTHK
jgi:hypothetical protein